MRYLVVFCLIIINLSFSQAVPSKDLIFCPTASNLDKGNLSYTTRVFGHGGVLSKLSFAFNDNFQFGISYGGIHLVGREKPDFNENPGVFLKYVFFTEDYYTPQIAFGFNNQGYGAWLGNRYETKSRGFYCAMSKNYILAGGLGTFGTHLGVNYTVTEDDGDDMFNLFVGIDKNIGSVLELLLEYDFAFNDDQKEPTPETSRTRGVGYLNSGVRILLSSNFDLEFHYNDILKNLRYTEHGDREVKISYRLQF